MKIRNEFVICSLKDCLCLENKSEVYSIIVKDGVNVCLCDPDKCIIIEDMPLEKVTITFDRRRL